MKTILFCDTLEQLPAVAQEVINLAKLHSIWLFEGEMGAGKTTLIKAICNQLGVKDNVASPTFALVNEYRDSNSNPVYHFDFYRINKLEEVFDFGYEEYFYKTEGICLIEWPELIEDILPIENVCKISITANKDESRVVSKI